MRLPEDQQLGHPVDDFSTPDYLRGRSRATQGFPSHAIENPVRLRTPALIIAISLTASCGLLTDERSAETPVPVEAQALAETQVPVEAVETAVPAAASTAARDEIVVPLTLHLAVEAGAPTSDLSSQRTLEDLQTIAEDMREIWAQAGIVLDPVNVHQIEMPAEILQGIVLGNTNQFFAQVNSTFFPQSSQAVNGFYVRSAFGVNGFTPQGSNLFFVVDEPSVPDERVSSHEVGHIFGLHHDLEDPTQLMFSGTNGTGLSELEQQVARYVAIGLFAQEANP